MVQCLLIIKEAFLIGGGKFLKRKNNFRLFDTRVNQRIETKNVAWSYSLDSSFQRLGF